jgi:hypothetical protein
MHDVTFAARFMYAAVVLWIGGVASAGDHGVAAGGSAIEIPLRRIAFFEVRGAALRCRHE